ncbi:MAG: NAD(P)-binding domain-containing protein, partial [Gammaproteobacteria bacterium]|nr:NAD(P)-binding domain-containing protein [Gammaproteobacteria bacterium]NIT17964.1 NAD(P)-binding domain-containing protein [Gammaproteobacteria bacterium]
MSCRFAVSAIFLFLGTPAFADTIAVIGTGDVGGALGPEFAAQGHTIVYGSRDPGRSKVEELVRKTGDLASATTPAEAAAQADIVVLAVPGLMVEE